MDRLLACSALALILYLAAQLSTSVETFKQPQKPIRQIAAEIKFPPLNEKAVSP